MRVQRNLVFEATFLVVLIAFLAALLGVSQVLADGPLGQAIAEAAKNLVGVGPYPSPNIAKNNPGARTEKAPRGFYACTDVVCKASELVGVSIAEDCNSHSGMRLVTVQASYFKGKSVSGGNDSLARHFEPLGSGVPPVGSFLFFEATHVAVVVEVQVEGDQAKITTVETGGILRDSPFSDPISNVGYREYRMAKLGGSWKFVSGNLSHKIIGWGVVDQGQSRLPKTSGRIKWASLIVVAVLSLLALRWFLCLGTSEKPLVVWTFRQAPQILRHVGTGVAWGLEAQVFLVALMCLIRPQLVPIAFWFLLRIPLWVYAVTLTIALAAYLLLKRGQARKSRLVFVFAPIVLMATVAIVVGAAEGINFSRPPRIVLASESAPELPPVKLTWWNGSEFTLNIPQAKWQDVWDAGRWSGTNPVYLL